MTDRKLSRFGAGITNDPRSNPGADPDGVDPDRPSYVRADEDVQEDVVDDDDMPECSDCGSGTVAYEDASVLQSSLPPISLCRVCILKRIK